MRDALLRGKLGISALSPRVTTGKEQWQEWHHDFFHNQKEDYIQVWPPSTDSHKQHSGNSDSSWLMSFWRKACDSGNAAGGCWNAETAEF